MILRKGRCSQADLLAICLQPISPADHVSTPLPAGTIPPRMPSPHLLQPATSLYGPSSPGASSGFSLSPRPAIRTPSPHTLPASASSLAVVDEMGPFNSARRHSYEGRRSKLPPVHTPLRSTGHNSKPSISFLRLEPPKPAKRKAVHVSLPIEANCSDDNEEAAKTKAQDAARQAGDDEDVVARKGREAVRRFKLRSQWTRRTPVDATDFALCDLQPNSADIVTRLAHPELAVKGLPHSIDIYLPSADEWNEQRPQMQPQGSPLQETILQAHDECIGKPDDDDTKVRDYLANSPRAFRRSSSPPGHVPRAMSLSIRPSGGSFASGAMSALGLSEAEAKARAVGDQSDDDASQNPRHQTDAASVKSTGASSSSTTGRPSWKDLSAGFVGIVPLRSAGLVPVLILSVILAIYRATRFKTSPRKATRSKMTSAPIHQKTPMHPAQRKMNSVVLTTLRPVTGEGIVWMTWATLPTATRSVTSVTPQTKSEQGRSALRGNTVAERCVRHKARHTHRQSAIVASHKDDLEPTRTKRTQVASCTLVQAYDDLFPEVRKPATTVATLPTTIQTQTRAHLVSAALLKMSLL